MNNSDTVDNICNNYKLYKLIFNNKVLVNIIYGFVNQLNKNKNAIKYENATFDWIIDNKHYNLAYDKIKNGIQFEESFIKKKLKLFISKTTIQNYSNSKLILNQLYILNKEILNQLVYYDDQVGNEGFNLLVFSITTQNDLFFNIVNNSNKVFMDQRKSTIYNYFDLALRFGNLEIIKILYDACGYDEINKNTIFNEALKSDNRDLVIKYLLENNFKINYKTLGGSDYYSNLLKLDFNILKNIYESTSLPIDFNDEIFKLTFKPLIFKLNSNGMNKFNEYDIELDFRGDDAFLNDFINCFKSTLFVCSLVFCKKRYLSILKKLNYIIDFKNKLINQDPQDIYNQIFFQLSDVDLKYLNLKMQELNKNNNNDKNRNNNSNIFSTLFSKFSINRKEQNKDLINEELKSIKFLNFNFKREIHRMFIFDFLKEVVELKYSSMSYRDLTICIMEFIGIYQEYELLNHISEPTDCVNKRSGNNDEYSYISSDEYLKITIKYLDSRLLKELFLYGQRYEFYFNSQNSSNQIQLFNPNSISLYNQLIFISNSFQDLTVLKIYISHFFNFNNNNLLVYQLESIGNSIKYKCKNVHSRYFLSSKIFNNNQYLNNYYFNNFREYFNWE